MTTLMELTDEGLKLPNGSVLRPGGRVRLLRSQAFQIPESVVETLGLELDEGAVSGDTEVVVWPLTASY